jgi:hypothetical protein
MTPLWVAAGCVAFLAVITAVVARALRDADPLDRPGAFRKAMADPNRDNDRDDLGGHR